MALSSMSEGEGSGERGGMERGVRVLIGVVWEEEWLMEMSSFSSPSTMFLPHLTDYQRIDGEEHLNALLQACPIPPKVYEDFAADDFEEVRINFEEIQAAFFRLQQQVELRLLELGGAMIQRNAQSEGGLPSGEVRLSLNGPVIFSYLSATAAAASALSRHSHKGVHGGSAGGDAFSPLMLFPTTYTVEMDHESEGAVLLFHAIHLVYVPPCPSLLPPGVHGEHGGGGGEHSAAHTATAAAVAHEGHDEGDGTFVNSSSTSDSNYFLTELDEQKKQVEANMADDKTLKKLIDADRDFKEKGGDRTKKLNKLLRANFDERFALANRADFAERAFLGVCEEHYKVQARVVELERQVEEQRYAAEKNERLLSELAGSRGLLAEELKRTVERLSKEAERDAELLKRAAHLHERDSEVEQLKARLAELSAQQAERDDEVEQMRSQLAQMRAEMEEKDARLKAVAEEQDRFKEVDLHEP
ncbi:unnamed protein product [Closterium sp. Naga37s-1]|nr:unnamed protein product [Closterium sp. Naga37s-1]